MLDNPQDNPTGYVYGAPLSADGLRTSPANRTGPILPPSPTWAKDSACIEWGDLFESFYDDGVITEPRSVNVRKAKQICSTCPVRDECLAFALEQETGEYAQYRYGIFGGKTPNERKVLSPEPDLKPSEEPLVCRNGHLRTVENTMIRRDGTRLCRTCNRESNRKRRWREREQAA